jgi:hypothetical protein
MGAEIRPKGAREVAQKAAREPDRAEAHAWSLRMEGYGGWLEVECNRCKTLAS